MSTGDRSTGHTLITANLKLKCLIQYKENICLKYNELIRASGPRSRKIRLVRCCNDKLSRPLQSCCFLVILACFRFH